MAIKYLSGKRLQGTAAERTALNLTTPPQTSWKEIGRTTLSSSGSNIDVRGTSVTRDVGTFDGSNDYITFATKFNQMQQAGSFSVWIKPANIGSTGNDIIFDNSDVSSANNGFSIRHSDPSGSKTVVMFGIWGSTDSSITTSNIWTGDEWQHLVVTYDGTTGKVYRNGTLVKSGALTANSSAGSYNARIGWGANGNDHKFEGKMAQALVYNDALTQSEVTTLYNNGTPITSPSTSGLVSKYNLTANTNDSQGSNNGTNTGVSFGSDTITGNFTPKDNLMILYYGIASGNAPAARIRFNSDDDDNYAQKGSRNGGSNASGANRSNVSHTLASGSNESDEFAITNVTNNASQEKLWITHEIDKLNGTNQDPNRGEIVGKWANTSNSISSVNVYESESGSFASGSEVVVLGCDNDEADSGTTFWQELNKTTLTSSADTITTGDTSAISKKYLWVRAVLLPTGGNIRTDVRLNNDSGSNYTRRRSNNGASDSAATGESSIDVYGDDNQIKVVEFFIINHQSEEKMVIGDLYMRNDEGAGNAPNRCEFVAKWCNDQDLISRITINNTSASGSYASGSYMTVWGSD